KEGVYSSENSSDLIMWRGRILGGFSGKECSIQERNLLQNSVIVKINTMQITYYYIYGTIDGVLFEGNNYQNRVYVFGEALRSVFAYAPIFENSLIDIQNPSADSCIFLGSEIG